MSRIVNVGAAQMGPIAADESRAEVVKRLIALLRDGAEAGCDLVVFPELALTTFFPRWFTEDISGHDHYFEREMPNADVQPLFDEAARIRVGFCLGYAELTPDGHRYNSYVLVDKTGAIVGKYRKVHIPGHADDEPHRPFQHLERRYFEESPDGFGVVNAFGGDDGARQLYQCSCRSRPWIWRAFRAGLCCQRDGVCEFAGYRG